MIKTEKRCETQTVTKYYYITSDDRTFNNYYDAKRHEAEITLKRDIPSYSVSFDGIDISDCTDIYFIESSEDIKYLQAVKWEFNCDVGEYDGPGWYLCFTNHGGDYEDTYRLYKADTYCKEISQIIDQIKHLTSN